MATLTKGKTFANGELVTPQKLHELVDLGTVSGIVNADISVSAAIADTKLAQITTANKVAQSAVANLTTDLAGKAAASHAHTIANVTGLQTALDGKQASGSYAPATGIAPSAITGTAVVTTDSRLSDARTPTSHTHGNLTNAGAIGSTSGAPIITGTSGVLQAGSFGTTAGTFCQGNDSRLSDARTPVTHTHAISDTTGLQAALDGKQAAGSYAPATGIAPSAITGTGVVTTDSRLSDARTPTAHTHGNLTNAGAIGATANLPVVTTTSGVLTTVPAGTAGQVLTSNGGTSAPSFQTLAATSTNANNLTGGSSGTVPYQSAAGTTAMLAAGTSGQVLRSNGAAAPSWLSLAASATTDATNAANIATGTLPLARIPTGTTSNTVALGNHTHDDRYYTETEMNTLLAEKQAAGSYAPATGIAQSAVTNLTTDLAGKAPTSHTHTIANVTNLQTELDSKVSGSNLGLCSAWVNFNHTRMLGVTNAANGESISVTAGSSSGTWNSTVAFSTGQIGIIYYITSAGAVPNASLGGINVSTLGFQIRAISGNTATIKLLAGPATASQTITGNGGTSGFQYMSYGIRAQHGIASITKAAAGSHMNFTFNFSTPFDFIDYCYKFQMDARSAGDFYIQTKGQSSIQIQVLNFSDASVSSQMNFMAFGL